MAEIQYIALLRGINVGGNNIIKMSDLRMCFESIGLSNVSTFIQSGNVLFRSEENDKGRLTVKIEKVLSVKFNYKARILILNHHQLQKVVKKAPEGFGEDAMNYRYDVVFLKEDINPADILKELIIKEGVDEAFSGESVLYFSRLRSRAGQSHLVKIIAHPAYKDITIRNWNTTTRLLTLADNDLIDN
jgi:uncharacterized protein (DUF1697 family)